MNHELPAFRVLTADVLLAMGMPALIDHPPRGKGLQPGIGITLTDSLGESWLLRAPYFGNTASSV